MFLNVIHVPEPHSAGQLQYLYVSLGNICNASCTYCDVHDSPPPLRRYGELELRLLFADAKRLGCRTVHFMGGGEPLVAPQFGSALAVCGELDLHVVITTNGSHLTRRLVGHLDQAVVVDAVIVSIDSHISQVHDDVRGLANLWALAVEGIRDCRAAARPPKVILNHVLTRANIGELKAFLTFAGSAGADAVNLIAVKDRSVLQASVEQRRSLAASLPELRDRAADLGMRLLCLDEDVLRWAAPVGDRAEREYRCLFPRFAVYVDFATGAVFPCDCTVHRKPRSVFDLGNIWSQPLGDIWSGESMRRIRDVLETTCDPGCKRDCDWNNMRTNEHLVFHHDVQHLRAPSHR